MVTQCTHSQNRPDASVPAGETSSLRKPGPGIGIVSPWITTNRRSRPQSSDSTPLHSERPGGGRWGGHDAARPPKRTDEPALVHDVQTGIAQRHSASFFRLIASPHILERHDPPAGCVGRGPFREQPLRTATHGSLLTSSLAAAGPPGKILYVGGTGTREAHFWNGVGDALARCGVAFFGLYQGFWDRTVPELTHAHVSTGPFDEEVHAFLGVASRTAAHGASETFAAVTIAQLRPRLAVIWNGLEDTQHTWLRAMIAADVPTLVAERAGFPGMFFFERRGINGFSEFVLDPDRIRRCEERLDAHSTERVRRVCEYVRASRGVSYRRPTDAGVPDLRAKIGAERGDRVVVFLGSWDQGAGIAHRDPEVTKAQSPFFESSVDGALAVADALAGRPDTRIVIRPHPLDPTDWSSVPSRPGLHLLADADVIDLIEQADVVAGLTTNLLYHASACEKPIVLMGRTALYGHGYTYDLQSAADLPTALSKALKRDQWEERIQARDRFFEEYLFHFCYSAEEEWLRLGIRGVEHAAQRLLDAMEPSADRRSTGVEPFTQLVAAIRESNRIRRDLEARNAYLERYVSPPLVRLRQAASAVMRSLRGAKQRGPATSADGGHGA